MGYCIIRTEIGIGPSRLADTAAYPALGIDAGAYCYKIIGSRIISLLDILFGIPAEIAEPGPYIKLAAVEIARIFSIAVFENRKYSPCLASQPAVGHGVVERVVGNALAGHKGLLTHFIDANAAEC